MQLSDVTTDVVHSHNQLLQMALDVGIPGLIAYLALVIMSLGMCWRIRQSGTPARRLLALGLAGVGVGHQVFGIADAIALGAKVGLFWWWSLALIAVLYSLTVPAPAARGCRAAGA
jgi:putative inorganic carbon (HCO3(-)) transporter